MKQFTRGLAWVQFIFGLWCGWIGDHDYATYACASACWWYLVANREESQERERGK